MAIMVMSSPTCTTHMLTQTLASYQIESINGHEASMTNNEVALFELKRRI
eukprot:CAMPEP_0196237354 /NCGR_PEP_ID=MMETSP0913-20130531/6420_1 /TAXON_ID=49265 /ORGANISM="Thalassiosira rotula, Strain GSO102" /LENGTH=49 /DNA_ID=CAMNT_0041518897 /DNA_START=22 /DNA_END=171 /DNA_ORIENTATION=+